MDFNFNIEFNFGKKEQKAREILSFEDFANLIFNKEKGYYDIQPFQFEMANWALRPVKDGTTKLLLATRGIGKSDIITSLLTLYRVYCEPTTSVQIISSTATKSRDLLKQISGMILSNMDFFDDIFRVDKILTTTINTKQNKRKEHSIFTGSLGGVIRSKHIDYIVFDDILSTENSFYKTKREEAVRIYSEALAISKNILIIGNATHPDDLHQHLRTLQAVDKFEIFNDDPRLPDFLRVDIESRRKAGDTEYSIQANYFGKILSDDKMPFYNVLVQSGDSFILPNTAQPWAFVDFALGGKDSNALTIAFLHNYKIYVLGLAETGQWSDFLQGKVIPALESLGIKNVFYEKNTTGTEPDKYFAQSGIASLGKTTTANKRAKISKLYQFKNDIILLSYDNELNSNYNKQIKLYSPIDNNCLDDAVDSLVMCLINMGVIDG